MTPNSGEGGGATQSRGQLVGAVRGSRPNAGTVRERRASAERFDIAIPHVRCAVASDGGPALHARPLRAIAGRTASNELRGERRRAIAARSCPAANDDGRRERGPCRGAAAPANDRRMTHRRRSADKNPAVSDRRVLPKTMRRANQ
ncbi:hypothetical protein C7S16_2094 [Burkholderia thailandensis]|uniref:Uncharacterized protein n=1 Tax=Burkholderia thailandensis TaxID=57975 RepID=A0AAW9D6S8_BURTH|nr:hypothetical protein [Burkholderia thailandensis]MDW9257754.1 hypothetical protein [Burkholderia thailandensis]